ncbi:hypothetical protein SUTMEG_10900 [Sutterella megalosphaeroides]|uniref:Uncharacterized protein n=1 Tax=Sutterella megalosphaeroides TaxID=2494234 RepID=A0A2Z6I9X5_9BURK|nr:hypothetical protein SUTMEG_10900 [Sutterella megalosphaeroides]
MSMQSDPGKHAERAVAGPQDKRKKIGPLEVFRGAWPPIVAQARANRAARGSNPGAGFGTVI